MKAKLEIHFGVKQYIRQVHYGNKRKCTLCVLYSTIIFFLCKILRSESYMHEHLDLNLGLYILRRVKIQLLIPEINFSLQTFNGSVLYASG